MFLYDEPPTEECWECHKKAEQLVDVKYWFRAVIDQLYGQNEFDAQDLERYLEECASYLDMKIPKQDLEIVRKNRTVEVPITVLEGWQQYNNNFLKSLAKTGT